MIKLANVSQLSKEWNIWVGNEMSALKCTEYGMSATPMWSLYFLSSIKLVL